MKTRAIIESGSWRSEVGAWSSNAMQPRQEARQGWGREACIVHSGETVKERWHGSAMGGMEAGPTEFSLCGYLLRKMKLYDFSKIAEDH